MYMKKLFFLFWLFLTGAAVADAQELRIEDCWQKARENYPLIRQHGLLEEAARYNISNLSKAWLPQVAVHAQFSYQSDVVTFPLQIPGVDLPTMDKDQYRATIDISQALWDGGQSRQQKKVVEAGREVEAQGLEVSLYALRNQVNQLFFGILLLDAQMEQLAILEKDLQSSLSLVQAHLQHGTAMSSDLDLVKVALLQLEQQRTELRSSRGAYTAMLSTLIHEPVDAATVLLRPSERLLQPQPVLRRPELQLLSLQQQWLETQKKALDSRYMPRLSLFLQGGYGRPGLNMLSPDFEFFYIGGLRLSWQLGALYTAKNDRNSLQNRQNRLELEAQTFDFNTRIKLQEAWGEVLKLREMLEQDSQIIALREGLRKAAESKYAHGVYTLNDLLKDIHAESQARQAKQLHEIIHLMGMYQYKVLEGE